MKKPNKKSMLFNISLVLISIIVLITALMALIALKPFKEGIGTRAFDVIKVYQETENRLFYVDRAAKLSAQQSAYDLAFNGGFETDSDCGKYKDYNVWSTTDPSIYCYPDNYKEVFEKHLNQGLRNYLSLLPSNKFIEFTEGFSIYPYNLSPDIYYETAFVNKSIIGIHNKDMQTNFYYGKKDLSKPVAGKYTIKPSFNIDFGYDINEYEIVKGQAVELIRECFQQTDLRNCINQSLPYLWIFGSCEGVLDEEERVFRFCVKSSTDVLVNNLRNRVSYEPVTYRFALYFPKPLP